MKVKETETGYMIRCPACQWHEFPKKGRPKATWTFNGDFENPTFHPSMNETINSKEAKSHNPELPTTRCHFIITNGQIKFQADCTHQFKNQTMKLEDW